MCSLIYIQPLQTVSQSYFLIFGGFLDTKWLLFVVKRQKKKDWCSSNLIRGKTLVAPQLGSMEAWYSRRPLIPGLSRVQNMSFLRILSSYKLSDTWEGDLCQFQSKARTEAVKYVCGKNWKYFWNRQSRLLDVLSSILFQIISTASLFFSYFTPL